MYFLLQKNKGRKFIKSIIQMKESKAAFLATFLVTYVCDDKTFLCTSDFTCSKHF